MELFGSSGIRGVANETVTPGFCLRVGMAVGTVVGGERVAVGRDTRATGNMFANAVVSGLQSVGCDVDRLGVLPTPAAQLYAERETVPAVIITASHNPAEYNGTKLVGADGIELPVEELERVETALDEDEFARARWDGTGDERRVESGREAYVEEVVGAVDRDRVGGADLTVALDPGHGAGALTSPEIFR